MYPKYKEVELPLLAEIVRRGGATQPSHIDGDGRNLYEALADYFELSDEDRNNQIVEANGRLRSKWENIIRFAAKELKEQKLLSSPKIRVWAVTNSGKDALALVESEQVAERGIFLGQIIDPATFQKRQEEAAEIGRIGEEVVLQHEWRYLKDNGRRDLARQVRQVSQENVAAGYDILSFALQGSEKFIEVKASKSAMPRFVLTINELNTARRFSELYWIYRVTNVRSKNPEILQIQNPAEMIDKNHLILKPTAYAVTLSEHFKTK